MTLIEGVGDEVIQFVGALLVFTVAALAWWSTNIRPRRYRTVVLMRSRAHHPVTVSIRTRPTSMITNNQATTSSQPSISDLIAVSTPISEDTAEETSDNSMVIPLHEDYGLLDADMAMLDNDRTLHFYRRIDSPGNAQGAGEAPRDEIEPQEEAEPASNAQIREMDSIVSAMEADVTAGCEFFTRPNENNSAVKADAKSGDKSDSKDGNVAPTTSNDGNTIPIENVASNQTASGETASSGNLPENNREKILIRLKYLNDTLKEVDGCLDELLKDFKWRHFSPELSADSRVRLIFNGRVLVDDAATLRACGLHHRAVVHCLVHPKRAGPQPGPEDGPSSPELAAEGQQERTPWDLENILMTLVSVALTVVWFFRCEYSNLFTASASVALFGLTVFYSVAIFGLYLSDTFHFDRRATQPIPNN